MTEPFFCSISTQFLCLKISHVSWFHIGLLRLKIISSIFSNNNYFFSCFLCIKPHVTHFICIILFKPSCHGMEYRVCHNLTQIYIPFSMLLCICIDRLVHSFSDFLSLLFLVQSCSSAPPEQAFYFSCSWCTANTDIIALTMLYCNLFFIHLSPLSVFEKLILDLFMFLDVKSTKQTYWIHVSGNRGRNWMFVVNFKQQKNLYPLIWTNQKIFIHGIKFQESFRRRKNYFAPLRGFLFSK